MKDSIFRLRKGISLRGDAQFLQLAKFPCNRKDRQVENLSKISHKVHTFQHVGGHFDIHGRDACAGGPRLDSVYVRDCLQACSRRGNSVDNLIP